MTQDDLKAIALKYDSEKDKAPKIVAKGMRKMAKRIIDVANEAGVDIKEDKDLAEMLIKLELYEEVPPELYMAIAEILAFVYSLNRDRGI